MASFPSKEKGLAAEDAEPLGLSIRSSCLSFLLCAERVRDSSAVPGWGSGEMPHIGVIFPPSSPCH